MGKGTFVATHAEQHVQYRFLKLVPDSGELGSEAQRNGPSSDCRRQRASADVARALAIRTGDAVLLQVRRALAFRGVPTILEDLWLPAGPFKGLTAERLDEWHGPMYSRFEADPASDGAGRGKISAARCSPGAAFAIPATVPLLSVERVAHTYHDAPMELRMGLYRTDTHHYRNIWLINSYAYLMLRAGQPRPAVNSIACSTALETFGYCALTWLVAIEF